MTRRDALRLAGTALFWTAGGLTLSAAGCAIVPPPVPGQPMTPEQEAYARLEAQREAHERRRGHRACRPGHCMN